MPSLEDNKNKSREASSMSYCINPTCQSPQNPEQVELCQSCGSKLLLQERYRAIKPIGAGGFGRTFLTVDESQVSKPPCVIKQFFLQDQGTGNVPKAVELFYQEAVRLDELGKHLQIPQLLTSLEQDNRLYLVQEFIEGRNLETELAEEGAFSETQIRQLLNDLLPVLQFVHDHQVIHRDIKPANIIRRIPPTPPYQGGARGGQLVLVDFGAAKAATGTALLKTGTMIGSAEYTAPEQVRGKAVFASDLYSLGVTCIHLLTETSPFDLFDSSEDAWVWRDYLKTPVSEALGQILDKMLQSATKRRYQSAAEVIKDLNAKPTTAATAKTTRFAAKVTVFKQALVVGVASGIFSPIFVRWIAPEINWFVNSLRSERIYEILLTTKKCPGCTMNGANLWGAPLSDADLKGANLWGANLRRADLNGAKLSGAQLSGANLKDAELSHAQLREAILRGANLREAQLVNAHLSGADLRDADLTRAFLPGADLRNAQLEGANLRNAYLVVANLRGANLRNADLTGANLDGADLAGANIEGAIGLKK